MGLIDIFVAQTKKLTWLHAIDILRKSIASKYMNLYEKLITNTEKRDKN